MLRCTRQVLSPGARCQLAMSHGGRLSGPTHSRCSGRSCASFTRMSCRSEGEDGALMATMRPAGRRRVQQYPRRTETPRVKEGCLARPSDDDDRRGSSASPSSIVTVSTAVMAPLASLVIWTWGLTPRQWDLGPGRCSSTRSAHLHVGVVDLDTLIHQTKIRIWYTLGTQDVRKRPTATNARLDQMA
jgi:hypothetical protein